MARRQPKRHRRREEAEPEPNGHADLVWLDTTTKVIKALDGLGPMAELTGKAVGKKLISQHVWNWKNTGNFPPAYFLIHQHELHKRGFDAPPELWRIIPAE